MEKILSLDRLEDEIKRLRSSGKRIVLCHGVFDLLHIGHIRYLRAAREFGDALVVTCTPDRYVDKGPGRPEFTESLRVEALAALDSVDFVAINEWPTAEETLRKLRPDVYVKGEEFKNQKDPTGKIAREAAVAREIGARIEFASDIVFSSSHLINKFFSTSSRETIKYLDYFRKRHTIAEIGALLDSFANLTVLLVGDAIIDEYIYCSPLGASSKDPVLALLYNNTERFVGGGGAIANHLAQFVKKVIWCAVIGDNENDAAFFRNNLASNVEFRPCVRQRATTVRKSRILDSYSLQKSLEIYHMEQDPIPGSVSSCLRDYIDDMLPSADLLMAGDFGNGCLCHELAEYLSGLNVFLAVNAQSNAGNRGHHTIGRYPRADFASLAVHEIRLEFRNRNMDFLEMLMALRDKLSARCVLLTEGRKGCSVLCGDDLQRAPSFAVNVVDRVGAGDALFSVSSLCVFKRFAPDITAFLGNIAGSLAVQSLGNVKAIGKAEMLKYIRALLK